MAAASAAFSPSQITTEASGRAANLSSPYSGRSKGGLIRGGQVGLQAGTDLTLDATALQSSGDTTLIAQDGNVSMGTVGTDYHYTGVTRVHKGTQTWTTEGTQQHTTQAAVGGKLAIQAKNDIITQGAELAIQGTAQLVAGRDIMLGATEDRYHDFSHTNVTSKSLVSSSQKLTDIDDQGTRVKGSTLSADSATLLASRDITLAASNVASTGNVDLQAGRDIDITTVTETTNYNYHHSERSSGLSGTGGVGVSIGTSRSQDDSKDQNVLAMGSTLGSVKGSVTVQAGQDVTIKGSDIIAGQNIEITGQNVTVTSAAQRLQHEETHERSKSGITLALSGAVGDAVNATVQSAQQAQQSSNGRLAALQGVKAGLTGFQAWQQYQLQAAQPEGKQNLYGISLSLGNQQSSSHSQSVQTQALASELNAGDNLSVRATGSGGNQQGDLTITGSSLKGGKDISLIANHDLTLQAARNESDLNGSNTSSGWNVGISVGVDSGGGGLSIFANANKGKGKENGDADQYTEAVVSAGQTLTLQSGRDTTLTGAQASGSTIQAEVGRNLTLASQQDHDHFDSKQGNVSIGGSYTFGTGSASASLSVSKQTIRSDFDSVVEQTGFYAGQGGFDITVGEHTQLDGAVLASTADSGRNRLSTDTLGWRNLENQARFQVENQGVGISLGTDLKQSLQTSAAGSAASTLLGGQGASDSDRSTTFAAISDGSIEIRGNDRQGQDVATLSRDAEHAANGLSPIFDKQKELDRLQVAQLLGEIGAQATQVVVTQMAMPAQLKAAEAARAEAAGDTAGAQRLREQANVLEKEYQTKWGIGSDFQKAAQAATAALQGLAGGNLEAALSGVAAPYLAGMIKDLTTDSNGHVNTGANAMAHAVLGAALAEAKGGSAAAGAVGGATAPLAANLLMTQLYPGKTTEQLSEEEKQTVAVLTTLTGTLAGALVAGNSAGAMTGGQTAKNEVENNSLNSHDGKSLMQAIRACAGDCDVEKLAKTIQQQEEKWDKVVADRCTGSSASLISCGNTLTGLQESMSMISSALGMAKTAEERTLLLHVYERQVTDINQTLDAMQSLGASASTLEQFVNSLAQIAPELMVGVGSTGKISLNSKQIGSNEKYQPNAGAVGNMKEFLNAPGFGQDLASSSQRTHKIVQGETVYKANKPIGDHIETGDQFYLDKAHKNHIEVFGRNNKVKAVLNLDGSYNETKTAAAKAQGRTIPK